MRLLQYNNDGEFSLTEDFVGEIPEYAILSHTWGRGYRGGHFQRYDRWHWEEQGWIREDTVLRRIG
jgi:hypothetical protein